MPNFRITRKRKTVEPPPPPTRPVTPALVPEEEKYDETEMEMSESSDEDYIDEAMSQLKVEQSQARPRQTETRPRNPLPQGKVPHYTPERGPQLQKRTTFAPQEQKPTSFDKHFGPTPRINDPYRRMPTIQRPVVRRKPKRRGDRLRFRSHYGTDAELLDTRTKSMMLLNHCFG